MKTIKFKYIIPTLIGCFCLISGCIQKNDLLGLNFCDYTYAVLNKIKEEKYSEVKDLFESPDQDNNNMTEVIKEVNSLINVKGMPNKDHIINKGHGFGSAKNETFVIVYFDSVSEKANNQVTFFLANKGVETKIIAIMPVLKRLSVNDKN